ncbi:hypothetical protein AOQ84DRAFT_358612 [Glonium stellatum]|uniref:Hemerythrin-like domain-containing protein n=1 Tax=Glonium stellatum TaxID=574774 RepID=A0A8E2FCS5_9PEZI|nr:hypothetical protein AOQ84DRAFT_358612 [Glonium stellatum]
MSLVHNCIIRSFNSIYQQARYVKSSEYKDFVSYAYTCYQALEAHHHGEEKFAFPEIEKATGRKGLMEVNVAQHEAFYGGFNKWGEYLSSLSKGDASQISVERFVGMMDAFLEPLSVHLNDEIGTLLTLVEFGDQLDLEGIIAKETEQIMAKMNKTTEMPVFMLNHDLTYESGLHTNFPPLPAFIKFFLMRVCPTVHYNWWKFATCDMSGRPKALYRAG